MGLIFGFDSDGVGKGIGIYRWSQEYEDQENDCELRMRGVALHCGRFYVYFGTASEWEIED